MFLCDIALFFSLVGQWSSQAYSCVWLENNTPQREKYGGDLRQIARYELKMLAKYSVTSYWGTSVTRTSVNAFFSKYECLMFLFPSTEFASSLVCVRNVSANRNDLMQSSTDSFSVIYIRKRREDTWMKKKYLRPLQILAVNGPHLWRINFGERRNRGNQNSDARLPFQGNRWFSAEKLLCNITDYRIAS